MAMDLDTRHRRLAVLAMWASGGGGEMGKKAIYNVSVKSSFSVGGACERTLTAAITTARRMLRDIGGGDATITELEYVGARPTYDDYDDGMVVVRYHAGQVIAWEEEK
jgi:hypothetical protein